MPPKQKPPQRVEAPSSRTSNPATFFFLHGYDDDADGCINIAQQFHAANKLPHMSWVFPNAPWNHDAMANAWYPPTSFSPIPVGRSTQASFQAEEEEEEEDEFNEEGEEEILKSVEYLCSLIDEEIKKGVKPERIVVGGFSQGCAISLVTALASRYQGRIGVVVGLSGYLPRGRKIMERRRKFVKQEDGKGMKVFLAHGTKDMLVPMRVFRDTKARLARTVGEEALESWEYEGMGHVTSGAEFRDMCTFLERIVPE
ncbi:alpha/beta-hydrolase [Mollisia scopiformis]|uniref:Acyl-protein thioesterase 1 n=1 Tax=Mollisia scopiformis TaxID=149040 RepID=A0A194X0Z9_MOLSC|nr:alpha/beta-hydrolase [Mollisia scopiformis]KUJ13868.1 alpha/beta-hydrolase [Mollisia scopiformis]